MQNHLQHFATSCSFALSAQTEAFKLRSVDPAMAQRRPVLSLALLAVATLFGSSAFLSSPQSLPRSEAVVAGGLLSLAAAASAHAAAYGSNGSAYDTSAPEDDNSGYLLFFSALTILSTAKAVFDTGGAKYNLGAAFQNKESK